MEQRRKQTGQRTGAATVEAALVLPILLLVFIGILEYGRYLVTYNVVCNATREGAEYASTHTSPIVLEGVTYGNATSDVVNVVNSRLAGQQLTSQGVSVYLSDSVGNNLGAWTSAAAGQYVCVQLTGTYQFIVPTLLFMPASFNVSIKSVKRSEGN